MLVDKDKYYGCTVCANVCKFDAYTMVADEEGFLYSKIDIKKSVKCNSVEEINILGNNAKSFVKKLLTVENMADNAALIIE